jgi:hypothetical protein
MDVVRASSASPAARALRKLLAIRRWRAAGLKGTIC